MVTMMTVMTTMTMMTVNILRPVNLVGQPARCLYVAEARSSVLSVTVCALEEHPYTIPTYQDWEVSGNIFVKKEYISSMLSVTPCAFPERHLSTIPPCIPTDFQSTRIEFFIFNFRYAPLFYSSSHFLYCSLVNHQGWPCVRCDFKFRLIWTEAWSQWLPNLVCLEGFREE